MTEEDYIHVSESMKSLLNGHVTKLLGPGYNQEAASIVADTIQNVWWIIFRKGTEVKDVSGYLYRSAHINALHFLHTQPDMLYLDDIGEDGRPVIAGTADPAIFSTEAPPYDIIHDVQKALDCLDLTERNIIWSLLAEGTSYRQLARELGMSESTLWRLARPIITKLRQQLRDYKPYLGRRAR